MHCTVPLLYKSNSIMKSLKMKSADFDLFLLVKEFILRIEIMLIWITNTIQIISDTAELPENSRNLKK